MLRTGEILQLRASDFLVSEETGIVHLHSSKSGLRHNTKESVTIESPMVRAVCLELVERRRASYTSHLPIWLYSGSLFRKQFAKVCEKFHVMHLNFRPYSLRRGGGHGLLHGLRPYGKKRSSGGDGLPPLLPGYIYAIALRNYRF